MVGMGGASDNGPLWEGKEAKYRPPHGRKAAPPRTMIDAEKTEKGEMQMGPPTQES